MQISFRVNVPAAALFFCSMTEIGLGSAVKPGLRIGGEYTVVRPLGEGGMGAVYLAVQASTGKERALKIMHREIVVDPGHEKRFELEAKVGARIKSEHVVDVLAAGFDHELGLPWMAMELLEGEDLRHRMNRAPLSSMEARVLFEQLCHAMGAAHAAGVVHRDLKPENVFLARSRRADAGAFTVKVLDFGIAKLVQEAGTRATKGTVGSPLWMAPEQTTPAEITPAADVWALGLLAFEVFTGRSFWRAANEATGNTHQLLREIVLDPIPSASERAAENGGDRLPLGFDAWFAHAVAREPSARYANAEIAWRAMRALFDDAAAPSDALAATSLAPSRGFTTDPQATGDASVYPSGSVKAVSAPPMRAAPPINALGPETPIVSVQDKPKVEPPPPSRRAASSKAPYAIGAGIAVAGIAIGLGLSYRTPSASPVTTATVAPSAAAPSAASSAPPVATESAAPSATPVVTSEPPPPKPSASHVARTTTSATTTTSHAAPGGFTDPVDRKAAVTWKVQDKSVRLFARLVSNDSNVADAVIRKAIEWNSWEYLRCYERVFGGAKDLPEGVVNVSFEIIDQLPRHAKLQSSTIKSDSFNDCVVRTLLGQTINAAGPDGKGKAVHGFRFVPNN